MKQLGSSLIQEYRIQKHRKRLPAIACIGVRLQVWNALRVPIHDRLYAVGMDPIREGIRERIRRQKRVIYETAR